MQTQITRILLAVMPDFLFVVLEDITKRVAVLQRLLASMSFGLLP